MTLCRLRHIKDATPQMIFPTTIVATVVIEVLPSQDDALHLFARKLVQQSRSSQLEKPVRLLPPIVSRPPEVRTQSESRERKKFLIPGGRGGTFAKLACTCAREIEQLERKREGGQRGRKSIFRNSQRSRVRARVGSRGAAHCQ